MGKKFWLKLMPNFFQQMQLKKLRQLNSDYVVIYLKLLLHAVDKEYIGFDGFGESIEDELSFTIDEDAVLIRETLDYSIKFKLVEVKDDKYIFNQMKELTASESESAERVRNHRLKKTNTCKEEVLHCNNAVTSSNASVTDNKNLLEKVILDAKLTTAEEELFKVWLDYKNWDFKDYGLKKLIEIYKQQIKLYGLEKVSRLVDLCISSSWKNLIWERLDKMKDEVTVSDNVRDYSGSFID